MCCGGTFWERLCKHWQLNKGGIDCEPRGDTKDTEESVEGPSWATFHRALWEQHSTNEWRSPKQTRSLRHTADNG